MEYLIKMPLENGSSISLRVQPFKTYGNKSGSDLINKYSESKIKHMNLNPLELNSKVLFIPFGFLEETIRVNGNSFNTRDFFTKIEETFKLKILSKDKLRAVRNFRNTSLELPESFFK